MSALVFNFDSSSTTGLTFKCTLFSISDIKSVNIVLSNDQTTHISNVNVSMAIIKAAYLHNPRIFLFNVLCDNLTQEYNYSAMMVIQYKNNSIKQSQALSNLKLVELPTGVSSFPVSSFPVSSLPVSSLPVSSYITVPVLTASKQARSQIVDNVTQQQKLRQQKLRQQKLRQQKLRQQKLRQQQLMQQALKKYYLRHILPIR